MLPTTYLLPTLNELKVGGKESILAGHHCTVIIVQRLAMMKKNARKFLTKTF